MCKTLSIAMATALFAGSAGIAVAQEGFGGRDQLERLSGVYASSAPEQWYGGFGTRRFSFDRGKWSLEFTHALDASMQNRTFQFRTEGPYQIGAASSAVPGAFDAIFFEDVKYVTLLTGDVNIINAFGFAGCGLKVNVEVDISKTGCAGWKPVAECREDHDLLAISAAGLQFGVRPRDNNMCSADRRPTALLQPVIRQ
ncbi:hypothetical protein FE840_013595 [Peteryoungia desertarenae]|uniref:Uncharacterized protein n=1 Tax=Peteryoungia desertarenae TaxID=1813451 RepID=A0ABX6QPP2_9HYPH|nr:hypothetical protein [Peteryoungia desertarenae]QLF70483.1 hypothetical protein FE840_013595 [Peteryoungia desertarenae]